MGALSKVCDAIMNVLSKVCNAVYDLLLILGAIAVIAVIVCQVLKIII